MQDQNLEEFIDKDIVIIGNGPSGLSLSYMLSGYIPYLVSDAHPDELLSARLAMIKNLSIVHQELGHLAMGLEGRSTNPISLLLDALTHPYADIGFELQPLVEWRQDGEKLNHVVLGKGPPGGSWHKMDPQIFTLSLASWMSLPGLPYTGRDGSEKRASAEGVAQYYSHYSKTMDLEKYFFNNLNVVEIRPMNEHCIQTSEKSDESYVDDAFNEQIVDISKKKCSDSSQMQKSCFFKPQRLCALTKALKLSHWRSSKKCHQDRCCKRRRHDLHNESSPIRKMRDTNRSISLNEDDVNRLDFLKDSNKMDTSDNILPNSLSSNQNSRSKSRSVSFSFCSHGSASNSKNSCDNISNSLFNDEGTFEYPLRYSLSVDLENSNIPGELDQLRLKVGCDSCCKNHSNKPNPKWLVKAFDLIQKKYITYICKYVVLANGASDLPNKLLKLDTREDPSWLVYDVRTLEMNLDKHLTEIGERLNNQGKSDPVLIVGAGLSAADAVIATRCRNLPVIHLFRDSNTLVGRQLPENMYPEYYKVHQMMQDGGRLYTDYLALPGYELVSLDDKGRSVQLKSQSGKITTYKVSFTAILIGCRPDISFLSPELQLGEKKHLPIDARTNPIDIDKLSHEVRGFRGLYAMGPLVGDNFVRFIPGGALAIVSDLYRKYGI